MLMQAAREFGVQVVGAHRTHLRIRQGDRGIAVRYQAKPEARAHLAPIIGVAHVMRHAPDMERGFEQAGTRADRERTGGLVEAGVEGLRGIMKIDAQLEQRTVVAGQIFMHQMRGADVFSVNAVFPSAVNVVTRMPEAIPVDVAEPGEPPVDHLGPASGHPGQAGDHPFAVVKLLIAGFERQIARLQHRIGIFEPHPLPSALF